MRIAFVNMGTGDVRQWGDVSLEQAEANVRAFIEDLSIAGVEAVRAPNVDNEGRFGFTLKLGERACEVKMPGCALDIVRDQGVRGPRLYVNGSSWLWGFALGMAHGALTSEE